MTERVRLVLDRELVNQVSVLLKFCLFCGYEADEEAEKKQAQKSRRKIYIVVTQLFKETLLKIAKLSETREKDVADAVLARINFAYDLLTAETKSHNNSYNSFLKPKIGGKILHEGYHTNCISKRGGRCTKCTKLN